MLYMSEVWCRGISIIKDPFGHECPDTCLDNFFFIFSNFLSTKSSLVQEMINGRNIYINQQEA